MKALPGTRVVWSFLVVARLGQRRNLPNPAWETTPTAAAALPLRLLGAASAEGVWAYVIDGSEGRALTARKLGALPPVIRCPRARRSGRTRGERHIAQT